MEVIFHNEALFRVLGDVSANDLQEFISKPVFLNDGVSLNLISAAQNKYSANVLSQPFKYKQHMKIAEKDVVAEVEQETKKS